MRLPGCQVCRSCFILVADAGISLLRKRAATGKQGWSRLWRKEVTGAAERRCRVGPADGARDGLDVLLAGFVVEVLGAPFYEAKSLADVFF